MKTPSPHSEVHPFRAVALAFLGINILFWSMGSLFVKYFSQFYDVWTQNAFRYSSAAIILLLFAAWRRRPLFRLTGVQWRKLILIALVNTFLQTAYASGYYFIYPSVASLVMRMDIVFICVLSFFLFGDERTVIQRPEFLIGATLAVTGLVVVVFGQDPEVLSRLKVSQGDFWIGVGLILTYAFFLALYSLTIKRAVRDIDPRVSFTHVAWMTSLSLIVLMTIFGHPSDLARGPVHGPPLMVLSAILCIIIAHTALFAALREVKAVVATSLMQFTPVLTCIFSALIFGDKLTMLQMFGGAGVLLGAWLAGMAQARAGAAHRKARIAENG